MVLSASSSLARSVHAAPYNVATSMMRIRHRPTVHSTAWPRRAPLALSRLPMPKQARGERERAIARVRPVVPAREGANRTAKLPDTRGVATGVDPPARPSPGALEGTSPGAAPRTRFDIRRLRPLSPTRDSPQRFVSAVVAACSAARRQRVVSMARGVGCAAARQRAPARIYREALAPVRRPADPPCSRGGSAGGRTASTEPSAEPWPTRCCAHLASLLGPSRP